MHAPFTAEDHFSRGQEALGAERHSEALEHFRAAHRLDATRPRYRSYYGLAIGLAEQRLDRALELCRSAAKEEFFNPEHYLNLARLHLALGFKAEAMRHLRRGLLIDPENASIAREIRRLGVRKPPPFTFLRRQHLLNRWIGKLMVRVKTPPSPALTPYGA
jgi:tetratricopeptide (TPR) repeat protein